MELSFGARQRPHPPLWIPTTDRNTLRYLARTGGHTSSTMIVPRAAEQVTGTFVNTLRYGSVKRSGTPAAPASRLSAPDILAGSGDFRFLMDQNLVLVGSPRTVAERIRAAASEGFFNTVLGKFTFGDIAGAESIASMELFSREVMPLPAGFTPCQPEQTDESHVAVSRTTGIRVP
ncbi:hypothetical protein ACFWOL_26175 [Streptomyces sp. NPDC058442]|uniref:hypothetical protein n=1 Tax=Streptomyces sp. NPDC058442 TaxID=3346503 RepID=UPI00364E972C